MNDIIKSLVLKYRTMAVLLILIIGAGLNSYFTLPREEMPEVNFPVFYINVHMQGISPEDSERLIIKPMEREFKNIKNVDKMRGFARENTGAVLLVFNTDADAQEARNDLTTALDKAKSDFPSDADTPVINDIDITDQPVVEFILYGAGTEDQIHKAGQAVKSKIEGIDGVSTVDIVGDRSSVVQVLVQPDKLKSYNLTDLDISHSLSSQNALVSGGSMVNANGMASIKIPALFKTVKEIRETPIKLKNGKTIKLKDIAIVKKSFNDRNRLSSFNGKSVLSFEIHKSRGVNLLSTVESIKTTLDATIKNYKDIELRYKIMKDGSSNVNDMVNNLVNNLISTIGLVILIVAIPLGLRSSILIAITIPTSVLAALVMIQMEGSSLHMMNMFALILAIGLLVDGAIVATEYADTKLHEGATATEAYIYAAQHMAVPLFSSTVTTLVAFAPLLFWPGVMGQFMGYLPRTLIYVLVFALIMAVIFLPSMGILFAKIKPITKKEHEIHKEPSAIEKKYSEILKRSLRYPKTVIFSTIGIVFFSFYLYAHSGLGVSFFPKSDASSVKINVIARNNFSPLKKEAMLENIANTLKKDYDFMAYVDDVNTKTGAPSTNKVGELVLKLVGWRERPISFDVIAQMQKELAEKGGFPGFKLTIKSSGGKGPRADYALSLQLHSSTLSRITPIYTKFHNWLMANKSLTNVESSLENVGYDIVFKLDRDKIAEYGISVGTIGTKLRIATNGLTVNKYNPDDADDSVDIVLRFPQEWREPNRLKNMTIDTPQGRVPLSTFVTFTYNNTVSTIRHENGQASINLNADVADGVNENDARKQVFDWFAKNNHDSGVTLVSGGMGKDQKKSMAFLIKGFGVALLVMALVLITQYNSLFYTALTMSAIVLSTGGVVLGLMITGGTYSITFSSLAVFALAGIVVNNNIVLIDTYEHLKVDKGLPFYEALIKTCAGRFRPIMLTVLTSAVGLLPSATQVTIDYLNGDFYVDSPMSATFAPISQTIIFGLLFATALTLVVSPCVIYLVECRRARKNKNITIAEFNPVYFDQDIEISDKSLTKIHKKYKDNQNKLAKNSQ